MADGRKQAGQPDLPAAPRGAGAGRPHLAGQREGRPRAHQAAGAGQARWQARGRRLSHPRWPRSTRSPRHILAQHREAGTAEAEQARDRRGPATSPRWAIASPVQQFRFHPSALLGLPILGAGVGAAALLALPLLALPGVPGWGALVVWGARPGGYGVSRGRCRRRVAHTGRGARGRQSGRGAGRCRTPPVDRGAPGHKGPGAVHGGPVGRGVGAARRRRLRHRSGARSAGHAASAVDRRLQCGTRRGGGCPRRPRQAARDVPRGAGQRKRRRGRPGVRRGVG